MSQTNQGNKQSEKGEYKGHGKREKETVKEDYSVGSSDGNGIRFTIPNHPDKSVMKPGGA
jgi:hypothetical protein